MSASADRRVDAHCGQRWHHDRCGKRLKLFIYLSDVTAQSHPTEIASGTHNTMYWSHDSHYFHLSRFSDESVRQHHNVAAMHGARGGGFLFDTNAMHRIQMDGDLGRLVVTLEFHAHGKILALRGSRASPCPSRKRVGWSPSRWLFGERGFPLYPPEEDASILARFEKQEQARPADKVLDNNVVA